MTEISIHFQNLLTARLTVSLNPMLNFCSLISWSGSGKPQLEAVMEYPTLVKICDTGAVYTGPIIKITMQRSVHTSEGTKRKKKSDRQPPSNFAPIINSVPPFIIPADHLPQYQGSSSSNQSQIPEGSPNSSSLPSPVSSSTSRSTSTSEINSRCVSPLGTENQNSRNLSDSWSYSSYSSVSGSVRFPLVSIEGNTQGIASTTGKCMK